jgi:hypothetical protein
MQKVKTTEYEFLARLISPDPLYECVYLNKILISRTQNTDRVMKGAMGPRQFPIYKNVEHACRVFHIICASSKRGAWKKTCKILNQQ